MLKEINGIIILNKPQGITSNKAVNKVKYLIGAKKAGHLGTLDPIGTGVLPITLGKCTKLFESFLKKTKTYKTTFEFGWTTDTLDSTGQETNRNDCIVKKEDFKNILDKYIGTYEQMPPDYSAKKINGKKAYELARAGQKVELKPKLITCYDLKLLEELEINKFSFELTCSSGFYVRSLCRDIATALSTYGVMSSITRTRCGNFYISDAYSLEDIEKGNYKILEGDGEWIQ